MKVLVLKLVWFFLPLALIFIPFYLFVRLSGENFYNIDSLMKDGRKYLIGYAYNQKSYNYLKWKQIKVKEKKKIWALGSSRVLQFRENMFSSSFYNSGYTIISVADFLPYLESLPKEKYPDLLIIGLDQWMFNDYEDRYRNIKHQSFWENSFSIYPSSNTIFSITRDLFFRRYGPSVVFERYSDTDNVVRIGLDALVNTKGFRSDGSFLYGNQINKLLIQDSTAHDFQWSATYQRIEKGKGKFKYGEQINSNAFLYIEEFLKFCMKNNIVIVGFIPPFASKVKQKMIENKKYGYIDFIYPKSKDLFDKHGFELWDLSDIAKYNSNDNEFIDGFHGGELTYLKMLVYMTENNSALSKHVNMENLRKDIVNRKNRYEVYQH